MTMMLSALTTFLARKADARRAVRQAAYLAEATDLTDLETRMRELDEAASPPLPDSHGKRPLSSFDD